MGERTPAASENKPPVADTWRLLIPGAVIGVGMGGFIDGIASHQIAQWHNMGSAVLPPVTLDAMHVNMRWDGWFHALTWSVTLIGIYMLLTQGRRRVALPAVPAFTGQLILGWGLFNLVEGIIDHHLLELHHVRDIPVHIPLYDWLFLAFGGVLLIAIGWLLSRTGRHKRHA